MLVLLAEVGADIDLIQVPWLYRLKIRGSSGPFVLNNTDHSDCLLAKSEFNIFLLAEYGNGDLVIVSLEIGNAQC